MTPYVRPNIPNSSHHVTLEDAAGTIYGLILSPNGNAIQRRPKQSSNFVPFTQNDWSGGRGLKMATDDRSRFADAKRLNTRRPGQITLGGLETYTSGHRQVEQHMPGDYEVKATVTGLTWRSLTTIYDYAHKVTASATGNRARIYIWLRRRGTPAGSITVELCADNAGNPGTVLKTVTETTDDITDTISQLYEFTFETVQAVTASTVYWVRVRSSEAGTSANCWEVGIDADDTKDLTKANLAGTWTNVAYDLYFRLVDDTDIAGVKFFTYKSQLYMLTRPNASAAPKLYMNGYRGVATGSGQSRLTLKDTTQAFTVNSLGGALLLIIDGPNSEWSIPYRTIDSNAADSITVPILKPFGALHVAGSTVYVVLGTDTWTEITGHGLTVLPTDIAVAGDVVYFAQGDTVKMRRMQETNLAGVWTRSFAEEDSYAKLLMVYRDATRGQVIMKANDYDNSNRPSVATARVEAWGTRLKFPWLIEACEATTGWTAAANVTVTADATLYRTGSKSIKLAIGAGAASGVFGYRAFGSPLFMFFRNKIRCWVYTTSSQEKGAFKLRLSESATAATTNQDIDLPALDANQWTQVELPIKHLAGLHNINSIGITRSFTGAMDFYIDGIEAVPDGTEVPLGNDTERINGLELYGDPEVPWVFRSGSIGSIVNGTFQPIPLREYTQVENIHNGVGHLVHDVYLYFSFLQGLEEYYRANLDDVGPNKDEGMPADRQGYITSMAGYPDRFLYNYDAGTGGYSSIMTRKGGGHHEDYRCDTPGKRIRNIFIQTIPGDMADRLWFDEGEDIAYLPLPGNTVNELTDATYRFTHEGVLETAWIGDDQQRIFSAVKLGLENASAARCIEWDYKLDEATAWTPVATPFTSGPVQSISLNVTGKRLKLRFRMQSNDNYETPRITSLNLSTTERPETRFSYSMVFVYQDNGRDLLGNVENYTRAETIITQLDTWMRNQTPLTMHSISETFDNKTVYVEPVVLGPVSNETGEQQEKLSATLIAVEPN
jgi:hypothetical protein